MNTIKKSTFLGEFKEFISRGSVIDLAVGVIIGGAFSKIITSLVDDIIMPLVGLLTGNVDISGLKAQVTGSVSINYGMFIQNTVDFVLIALFIFLIIKGINVFRRKEIAEMARKAAEPPAPSRQEELLTEIRDLLKKQQS